MKTLELFCKDLKYISTVTNWYIADLAEYRGKQELYIHQAPQKLKTLREHAIIESSISSNRLEGIEIEQKRIGTVIFGKPLYTDRNEEEVAGYRKALTLIHENHGDLPICEQTIKKLHALTKGEIWDAGKYKEKNSDIIEKSPDGRERRRFRTVLAQKTEHAMRDLVSHWENIMEEKTVHPLIALIAFNLDFLCIHPFRDGNGRVSRLLLLLQAYHLGYEVGRYVSLEKLIEENKERYYETLEQSSVGWHSRKHDPWPFIHYILSIFKIAYKEFENRVGQAKPSRGSKTEIVIALIDKKLGAFTISDLKKSCPEVGIDMIRKVLKDLKKQKIIFCIGRGKNATWKKLE